MSQSLDIDAGLDLIQAANKPQQERPNWLQSGATVLFQGKRVRVTQVFGSFVYLTTGKVRWAEALESGLLQEATDQAVEGNIFTQLRSVPSQFRGIADSLAIAGQVSHLEVIDPEPAQLVDIPTWFHPNLSKGIKKLGIKQLYSHQVEAAMHLEAGDDVVLCTPTASGKTLSFNPAILQRVLHDPMATALYFAPLKALSNDQQEKVEDLIRAVGGGITSAVLTGDTDPGDRASLFQPAPPNLLFMSPDLFHHQIPKINKGAEWEGWREFLRNLRFVVIDEAHTYTSSFGAQFTSLQRRLRIAVRAVGGDPEQIQYIVVTATVGNPHQMAMQFSGRLDEPDRMKVVDRSGAGSKGRTFIVLNPSDHPSVDVAGMVLDALRSDLSGIVFANTLKSAKGLVHHLQSQANADRCSDLARRVEPYYGGLQWQKRYDIINKLKSGKISWLFSTSALEAGIDLPNLDCVIIRGYPNSLMSFRQRIGRCGRSGPGLVIFLPLKDSILDHYYTQNPTLLLHGDCEISSFNPNYPPTVGAHLRCAAYESRLNMEQVHSEFGNVGVTSAEVLVDRNDLSIDMFGQVRSRGPYPHRSVSIRGNSINTYKLVNLDTGEEMEDLNADQAYRECFPEAIYALSGEVGQGLQYFQVAEFLDDQKKILLQPLPGQPDIETQARSRLLVLPGQEIAPPKTLVTSAGDFTLTMTWGTVLQQVTGFQKYQITQTPTCTNKQCSKHKVTFDNRTTCPSCARPLHRLYKKQKIDDRTFEKPYQTKIEAPVLKLQADDRLHGFLRQYGEQIREFFKVKYANALEMPHLIAAFWDADPAFVGLHSVAHQLMHVLQLVSLHTRHDLNVMIREDGVTQESDGDEGNTGSSDRIQALFWDTTHQGNGASDLLFQRMTDFSVTAMRMSDTCGCDHGCPNCLTSSSCPQANRGLLKDLGRPLLELISKSGS